MKNGIISLNLFSALDQIAREAKITDGEWAKAAGMKYASRVAEIRWMARLEEAGQKPKRVGRAFTVPKLAALIGGLQSIMGGETLNKELLKHTKDAKTTLERVLFKVLALAQDISDLDQLDGICETMIRASSARDKKRSPSAVKARK